MPDPAADMYVVQLTADELTALGYVSAQWAVMEMLMERNIVWCTTFHQMGRSPLEGLTHLSFKVRRRLLHDTFQNAPMRDSLKKTAMRLYNDVHPLEGDRNHLLHGVATRVVEPEAGLRFAKPAPSPRPYVHDTSHSEIVALGDKISRVNHRLNALSLEFAS